MPQGPDVNGISNHDAPLLSRTSRRVLAPLFALVIGLWGGLFLFAPQNRLRQSAAVFALLIFGTLFVVSCGGGGSGGATPPPPPPVVNTTTVLVTGTSGNMTASTVVTLTVQ
jgi:hypothetical protein